MNIAGAVVTFLITWWTVFLAVLPLGVRSRWESEADGVTGADPGRADGTGPEAQGAADDRHRRRDIRGHHCDCGERGH